MSAHRANKVIIPNLPEQRWSCHSCGKCCKTLVVHLSAADRKRIDKQGWAKKLDVEPYVPAGRGYALNKRADGSCVFLDENNLCLIHAKYGEPEKPLACIIFPFSARAAKAGWQTSVRFDCPSVASSKGKPLGEHADWLSDLTERLPHAAPDSNDTAKLPGGVLASVEQVRALREGLIEWIGNGQGTFPKRLLGFSRLVQILAALRIGSVPDSEFAELVELLFKSLPTECDRSPAAPSSKQQSMLRQIVFAHAESVSIEDLQRSMWGKMRRRIEQLSKARRFLSGKGVVPSIPGMHYGSADDIAVTFDQVESVSISKDSAREIEPLLVRYLHARLESRSVWGDGYYDWPIVEGLGALCTAVAATGWLARYFAVIGGRNSVKFADVAQALGVVDRSATRIPALGTSTERMRMRYLLPNDGLARLLAVYAPVEEQS